MNVTKEHARYFMYKKYQFTFAADLKAVDICLVASMPRNSVAHRNKSTIKRRVYQLLSRKHM